MATYGIVDAGPGVRSSPSPQKRECADDGESGWSVKPLHLCFAGSNPAAPTLFTGLYIPVTKNSVLRFLALPSGVLLSATGLVEAYPL